MKKELPVELLVLLIILLVGTPTMVAADSTDTFTSTASLFTIGTGARPLGMGNAFVGLADDENAALYNPAGLAFLEKTKFTSFYSNQYSSFHYGSLGIASTKLGLSYLQLSSGNLTKKDLYGNSTGEFSYTSRGLLGTYGAQVGGNLALGLQGKAYQLANPSLAHGFSLSPALLYRIKPFQFGTIFKNLLSTDITHSDDNTEHWQEELVLGIAYNTERLKLGLDFDAQFTERGIDPGVARFGAEGRVFPHILLRAGVTSKLQSSLGISMNIKDWQFDYSLQFHDELKSTHRLSFTIKGVDLGSLIDPLKDL